MNYEEKYNQTIESIKRIYVQADSFGKELMEKEFPELRESEDERIRKFLHHTFTAQYLAKDKLGKWHGEPVTNILAWLEKQGEHPYPETLDKAIELYYYSYGNGKDGFDNLSLEQFKDIIKTFVEDYGNKTSWSEEDEKMLNEFIESLRYCNGSGYNKQIDWLKSLKDRVIPQPKQEWSEEDYNFIKELCGLLASISKDGYVGKYYTVDLVEKLKSLKPQNRWKPSEGQMKSLKKSFEIIDNGFDKENIRSLYCALKHFF